MRYRFTGAMVAAAAATLIGMPNTGQTQTNVERPERIAGQPNLNGIWQAMNTANWNLEAHSAEQLEDFWQLGAIGAIPAGQSVITSGDGTVPYLPGALEQRDQNRADWPAADPEAACYLPGIPRATYMPYPFQIVQGGDDILFVYEYASANRLIHMSNHREPPVDTWMGWSNGSWDGDTLVVETTGFNGRTWLDRAGNHHSPAMRVVERFTLMGEDHLHYQATIEDPNTFSEAWTIEMPLYRRIEPNAQLLEYKCVEFSEMLLYGDLIRQDGGE
jgi:hypothetical protein